MTQQPTIILTNEASARLLGINPALYDDKLTELSRKADDAYAEMQHWNKLADEETPESYLYERRAELKRGDWLFHEERYKDLYEVLEKA